LKCTRYAQLDRTMVLRQYPIIPYNPKVN